MPLKPISLATTLLALAACASCARSPDPFQRAPAPRDVAVAVQNHGDTDVAIYVLDRKRGRRRIGTVMRASTAHLAIPGDVLSGWNSDLVAVPIGGGPPSAPTCPRIKAGTHLLLVIERESVLSTCRPDRAGP